MHSQIRVVLHFFWVLRIFYCHIIKLSYTLRISLMLYHGPPSRDLIRPPRSPNPALHTCFFIVIFDIIHKTFEKHACVSWKLCAACSATTFKRKRSPSHTELPHNLCRSRMLFTTMWSDWRKSNILCTRSRVLTLPQERILGDTYRSFIKLIPTTFILINMMLHLKYY